MVTLKIWGGGTHFWCFSWDRGGSGGENKGGGVNYAEELKGGGFRLYLWAT